MQIVQDPLFPITAIQTGGYAQPEPQAEEETVVDDEPQAEAAA